MISPELDRRFRKALADTNRRAEERGRASVMLGLEALGRFQGGTFLKAFDEDKHPRNHGEFASKEGASGEKNPDAEPTEADKTKARPKSKLARKHARLEAAGESLGGELAAHIEAAPAAAKAVGLDVLAKPHADAAVAVQRAKSTAEAIAAIKAGKVAHLEGHKRFVATVKERAAAFAATVPDLKDAAKAKVGKLIFQRLKADDALARYKRAEDFDDAISQLKNGIGRQSAVDTLSDSLKRGTAFDPVELELTETDDELVDALDAPFTPLRGESAVDYHARMEAKLGKKLTPPEPGETAQDVSNDDDIREAAYADADAVAKAWNAFIGAVSQPSLSSGASPAA